MVTFQFAKMSKGQNRLPWVYIRLLAYPFKLSQKSMYSHAHCKVRLYRRVFLNVISAILIISSFYRPLHIKQG